MLRRIFSRNWSGRSLRLMMASCIALTLFAIAPPTNLAGLAPASALAAQCRQPSRAFIDNNPSFPNPVQGTTLFLSGIVKPGTTMLYRFYAADGRLLDQQFTTPAGGNCVIDHTKNPYSTFRLPLGFVRLDATYVRAEDNQTVTQQSVAVMNLIAPPPPPPCEDNNNNGICDRDEFIEPPQDCTPGRICGL